MTPMVRPIRRRLATGSRAAALIAVAVAALFLAACSTSSGGSNIVFTSERDSDKPDIYSIPSSGGEAQRLTNTSATETGPKWSPSHDRVAFLSDRGDDFELYVMDKDGEMEEVVVGGDGNRTAFSWSPDGKRIAYVSDEEGTDFIYIKDLELGRKFRLSTIDAPQQLGSWSPDGEWVVFAVLSGEREGIHRKNPGGVDEVQLTENADTNPVYSPDGRFIAFTSTRDAEESEIYVMTEDGSEERNVTRKPGADYDFDWSPDSKRLTFVSEREDNPELFSISVDGEDIQRLTVNNSIEKSPRYSPKGDRIVFASNSDGDFDIFTMRKDGTDQRRITATDFDDVEPDW